jgi:hypothetical protein
VTALWMRREHAVGGSSERRGKITTIAAHVASSVVHVSPIVHVSPVIHVAPHISTGGSVLQTAVVAIGATLVGSLVGAYGSFRASVSLENRRREARAAIRRKAKLYTPLRQELKLCRERLAEGRQFGPFGVARDPTPTISPPPELLVWRQFVEDGRAMSASKRVRSALDGVEQRADEFNGAMQTTTRVFNDRGAALLADLGSSPAVINWLSADLDPLMKHEFASLNILGTLVGPVPTTSPELQGQFETAWRQDAAIAEAESALTQADRALSDAVEEALHALEKEMEQIATKYEREIPDE